MPRKPFMLFGSIFWNTWYCMQKKDRKTQEGGCKDDGARLFSVASSARRDSGHKLQHNLVALLEQRFGTGDLQRLLPASTILNLWFCLWETCQSSAARTRKRKWGEKCADLKALVHTVTIQTGSSQFWVNDSQNKKQIPNRKYPTPECNIQRALVPNTALLILGTGAVFSRAKKKKKKKKASRPGLQPRQVHTAKNTQYSLN